MKLFLPNGHAIETAPTPETAVNPQEYDYASEASQIAAQCWCDEETSGITMDPRLAGAVAKRIAFWMQTAAQGYRGAEFYRDLLDQCGRYIGIEAFTSDDGSVQQDTLALKIPELVLHLIPESERASRAASVPVMDEKPAQEVPA